MAEILAWIGGAGFIFTLAYNIGFSVNNQHEDYGWSETVLGLAPIFFLIMLIIGALMSQ